MSPYSLQSRVSLFVDLPVASRVERTAVFNNKPAVLATITAVKFTRFLTVIHTGTARNRTLPLRFLALDYFGTV